MKRQYTVMKTPVEIQELMEKAEKHFSPLGFDVNLKFERAGQGTFENTVIGAVANRSTRTLTVNIDWYGNTTDNDIKYIIWHEMRHMYQWSQIMRLHNNAPIQSKKEIIEQWEYEFLNYIENSPETEERHMKQEIEIDAYAFALYMMFRYCADENGTVNIGLPPMIEDELMKRVKKRFMIENVTGKLYLG